MTAPWEQINEELAARCWTAGDLASQMRQPMEYVTDLLSGKRWITASDSVRMGEAFGVHHEFFTNLQVAYHKAQPPPAGQVASAHLNIFRCHGRDARGSQARCHPYADPGGWDVGIGMIGLNVEAPFKTLAEAKEFALLVQWWLTRIIEHDRAGTICNTNRDAQDLGQLTEADFWPLRKP